MQTPTSGGTQTCDQNSQERGKSSCFGLFSGVGGLLDRLTFQELSRLVRAVPGPSGHSLPCELGAMELKAAGRTV